MKAASHAQVSKHLNIPGVKKTSTVNSSNPDCLIGSKAIP